MTVNTSESHTYTAVIATLMDPTHPRRRVAPNIAQFDSEHAALRWLRDHARAITPSTIIATASVLKRVPDSRQLVPIHHIGAATAHEIALELDILVTRASIDQAPRQGVGLTNSREDPARAATAALDQALDDGVVIDFADPAEPHRLLRIGMIAREWATIEYRQDDPRTGELHEIGPVGVPHYGRVDDMLDNLAIGAPYRDTGHAGSHLPPIAVPCDVAEDLSAFQARIDAFAARARLCACDHPETLCTPTQQEAAIHEHAAGTDATSIAVSAAASSRRHRRATRAHHRPKVRI